MKKVVIRVLLAFLLPTCWNTAAGQDNTSLTMKIAIGNPAKENNFGWTPFAVLKKEIEGRSEGRLKVELSAQMMGKSSLEMIEMVHDGVVQARDFADGHLATIYPPIQVLSIPYLFADREIAWQVLDGPFGQHLIEDMAAKTGLRPLYWIENGGFRHYSNNKRPIHSPADMVGLRFRTMESPLHVKIAGDLGARGVPIGWANVYEAIEAGIVDGQENSISTFLIPHFERIQKYIVMDGHIYAAYTLLMNDAWYQNLPQDLKNIINHAKQISATANRGLAVANELADIRYLRDHGIEITYLTSKEKKEFRDKTRQSAISWLTGTIGRQWVEEALDATRQAEETLGYRQH